MQSPLMSFMIKYVREVYGQIKMGEAAIRRKPSAVMLSRDDFNKLPEYSCSLPTGTTTGKRWKRKVVDAKGTQWIMGEYGEVFLNEKGEERIVITWRDIFVVP